jgi:flagellar protein FlbT
MSTLVLELRQGDLMVVNGAPIRFRNRTRIELAAKARFLFGKQLMPPEAASTPARRIYFALQTAYIGTEEERGPGLVLACRLIAEFQAATTSPTAQRLLAEARALAEADECYRALKLVRRVMLHEAEVLGLPPPPAAGGRTEGRGGFDGPPAAATGAGRELDRPDAAAGTAP